MLDLPQLTFSEEDLAPQVHPVVLGRDKYELREATGEAACNYRNKQVACSVLGPDGKVQRIVGIADCDTYLVSMCLYDDQGRRVSEKKIRDLPDKVLRNLIKAAKMISGLSEEEDKVEILVKKRDELSRRIEELQVASQKESEADPTSPGSK